MEGTMLVDGTLLLPALCPVKWLRHGAPHLQCLVRTISRMCDKVCHIYSCSRSLGLQHESLCS